MAVAGLLGAAVAVAAVGAAADGGGAAAGAGGGLEGGLARTLGVPPAAVDTGTGDAVWLAGAGAAGDPCEWLRGCEAGPVAGFGGSAG